MAARRRLFGPNNNTNYFKERMTNNELVDLNGNDLPKTSSCNPQGLGLPVLDAIFKSATHQQSEITLVFENDAAATWTQTKKVHLCGRPPANPELDLITSNVIQCLDLTRSETLLRIMLTCDSLTSLTMENVLFPLDQLVQLSFKGLKKLSEIRFFNCDVELNNIMDHQESEIKRCMSSLETLEVINCAQRLVKFCGVLMKCTKLKHYSGEMMGNGLVLGIYGMKTISLRQAVLTMDKIIQLFKFNPNLECVDLDGLELIGYDTTAEALVNLWLSTWKNFTPFIRRVKLCDMRVRLIYRKWRKMVPVKSYHRYQPFIPSHFLKPGPLHTMCLDERDFYDAITLAHPDVVWFHCPNDEEHIERTALEPSVFHWQ